ncbi:MAG: MtaA/CmuA family methyltransferase [Caldilineaceae bacterium SB0675_bin_29]|uniref:MtaA/CmuA family methyltransferase n=1 Tax=Caldilineaceae bacterium SB0675_bin_29 TaxID=2605266 RepID=A0A6B1G1A1_9CHLR|nr:MtaA/CmuA family methyltransferase [Caldilineaceae bacterium SB0675_bin_29]
MEQMTSKQRFLAGLNGEPVDRPPAASIVSVITYELMDITGAHFPHANIEPEPMATLAAGAHEVMGFDSVMPIFSIAQEAMALGCQVDWSDTDMMPNPTDAPWADRDVDIELPDGFPDSFLEDKYVKCSIDAIRLLKQHFGDDVMVLGKVMGPWTLSYHCYNTQEFLFDTIMDPDRVRKSLETLAPVPVAYASAQLEAGADAIVWADHATGDLVRNTMYRDFLLPHHQNLIPQVDAPVILHCCGKTLDRVEYFSEAGFACYHFESANPPDEMVEKAAGKMKLTGNVNTPITLYSRGPAEARAEAQAAIDAGVDIIAPECAVPLQAPVANLKAIVETCVDNPKH